MRLSIPALSAFAATAFSQFFTPPFNTSQEYQLRTCLLPGQPAEKARFENLWLVASHTGAGLNDAVLYSNQSYAIRGFLNVTNTTQLNGEPFYNQEFDLGNTWPYGMSVSDVNFYAAWEPVRINAGLGDGQFFINETGLQWGSETAFGGWLVCDWWHGVPQLFAKWGYYHYDNPSSCADVQLRPVYL